jgi:hypothetical protein
VPRPQRMLAARAPAHAVAGRAIRPDPSGSVHAADSVKLAPASADAAVSAVWGLSLRDQVISTLAATALPPAPDRSPGSAANRGDGARREKDTDRVGGVGPGLGGRKRRGPPAPRAARPSAVESQPALGIEQVDLVEARAQRDAGAGGRRMARVGAGDQTALAARQLGDAMGVGVGAELLDDLHAPGQAGSVQRFIAGEPMKPATKRLAGWS